MGRAFSSITARHSPKGLREEGPHKSCWEGSWTPVGSNKGIHLGSWLAETHRAT